MPRVAPAARNRTVVEAISSLQRLQEEMTRLSPQDKNYKSQRLALAATIRDLRKAIRETTNE